MERTLPDGATYTVIGAGIHGLSTAWHLAMALERTGKGSGTDIIVLDKTGPGAGASGIACGCVRNLYMTEPLHAILRHSVDVWMHDPVAFGFQQVGYVSAGEANQAEEYDRMTASQNAVGYPSTVYHGREARDFLTSLWPDFKTDRIEVVIHEHLSGYAGTLQAIAGLAEKCRQHGVRIFAGVEVTGYDRQGRRVSAVETDHGTVRTDAVLLCAGAWMPNHWALFDLPDTLDVGYRDGSFVAGKDMWTFWRLLEGEVYHDRAYVTAGGHNPPVLHVELMNTPVVNEETGQEIQDNTYVYWKNGNERMDRPGLQGGTMPIRIGPKAALEPYGHANDAYQADPWFSAYLPSAMGALMGRFEGHMPQFRERRNGGIGAFTPDNVPVFDWIQDNVYMIADSNHGFKMTGVGKLVAEEMVGGETSADLKPFGMARFAAGQAYGSGVTNCPWV